jgi:hypothetical protein
MIYQLYSPIRLRRIHRLRTESWVHQPTRENSHTRGREGCISCTRGSHFAHPELCRLVCLITVRQGQGTSNKTWSRTCSHRLTAATADLNQLRAYYRFRYISKTFVRDEWLCKLQAPSFKPCHSSYPRDRPFCSGTYLKSPGTPFQGS